MIGCLKDCTIIKKIVSSVHKNSLDFQEYRNERMRYVLLAFIDRHRFRKMLNQVTYINTFKRLYKIHKQHEELKHKMIKTLNFKYELFAENQRLFMENREKHKRKVEIHIGSSGLKRSDRETYYKFRERLNAEITRIFSFVKGEGFEIVYISPY